MTHWTHVSALSFIGVIIFLTCNVYVLSFVRTQRCSSRDFLYLCRNGQCIRNLIKEIANLLDDMQVEVFCTIVLCDKHASLIHRSCELL